MTEQAMWEKWDPDQARTEAEFEAREAKAGKSQA